MITHLPLITRIRIENSEKLYPDGIEWEIAPGVNSIIGGTGLGKTTLLYAVQFAIFGKLVVEGLKGVERIEREFFRGRMSKKKGVQLDNHPPMAEVSFLVGAKSWIVRRNLLTGSIVLAEIDGEPLKKTSDYPALLADAVGLERDFDALASIQSHLLFFGEGRYLVAWENLLQNELLNLIFADNERYKKLTDLWNVAKSADSTARNLSAQAARLERDLEDAGISADIDEQEVVSFETLQTARATVAEFEQSLQSIRQQLDDERQLLADQNESLSRIQAEFNDSVARLEEASDDLDQVLFADVTATPTGLSVRSALENFYDQPLDRTCPSCGRPGLEQRVRSFTQTASRQAKTNCIICSKTLQEPIKTAPSLRENILHTSASKVAAQLQKALFVQIQTKSRIDQLSSEESNVLGKLATATSDELRLLQMSRNDGTENSLKITIRQLRASEQKAARERDNALRTLRRHLKSADQLFQKRQNAIAKAFKKYASLYLDEPCDIRFLQEKELPSKRGSQVKPPHSAFYPVISGEIRPTSQDLSDAQRSFVDLAFRMAVLDVWHQQTKATATLIVETPEGAVDLAYMGRVAQMLRAFGEQGHTLLITTNLNNEVFLPELMASRAPAERGRHILNLLELGLPRAVQKETSNARRFARILKAVARHTVAK